MDYNLRGAEGCPDGGCEGYELVSNLNFDENGDGEQNDTYNQDDGTWEWEFDPTHVFVGSFEQLAGTPTGVWEFSGCNDNGSITHGFPAQEHFNECDGFFQGEAVEELTSGQYTSRVTIHSGNLFHLSNYFSPDGTSTNWTIKFTHIGVTIFEHTYAYSPYLSFLPPSDAYSESYTYSTNQVGAVANSSYSIRTPNTLFRGKFEYNGYSITWK